MSKAKSITAAHQPETQRKLQPKTALFLVIVAVIIVAVVVLRLAFGGGSIESVLETYYEGLYATTNIEAMAGCLPEGEKRERFELVFTMGGVSNMADGYHMQAEEWVGENIKVDVNIVSQEKPTAGALNVARAENSAIQSVVPVVFDVRLTGDNATHTLRGQTIMYRIGGEWFIEDYNIVLGFVS